MTDQTISTGQLAKRAGVNVETLRYYERRGILRSPARTASGWRRYDRHALRTVLFVRRAQGLGFTLDEIQELLKLRATPSERACAKVQARAAMKLDEIDAKIRDLEAVRTALARLASKCRPEIAGGCPVLDALIDDDMEEHDD